MDRELFNLLGKSIPEFNPIIGNGLAVHQMQYAERYIDMTFRSAEKSFPKGLTYRSYRRCTPQEQYAEITRKRNGPRSYEIARSDIYMVKYLFDFNGEEIRRYIFLPYIRDGGIITLRGSTFSISPILTDKSFSVGQETLFIPLSMAKVKFERTSYHFYANGKSEAGYIIHASLYNRDKKTIAREGRAAVKAKTTLAHYLFCKKGVGNTFKEYAAADIIVGGPEVNSETYPANKYSIYSSSRIKPRYIRDRNYIGTDVRIAIPNEQVSVVSTSLVAAFFYVADHFPYRILPEHVNDDRLWKILMGKLIFPAGINEGKLVDDINIHLDSLDCYLDEQVKDKLRADAIYCNDLYELFVYVMENFTDKVTQVGSSISSMYGRRLTVINAVLYDITSAIFKFMFKFKNQHMSKRELTRKDIENQFNFILRPELIIRLNHKHREVSSVAIPGDNKLFKLTSNLILQTDSSGFIGKSKASSGDPSRLLHSSIAEVGSYLHLPKSEPTGRGRINPFVHTDDTGLIERKEAHHSLLDNLQTKIER